MARHTARRRSARQVSPAILPNAMLRYLRGMQIDLDDLTERQRSQLAAAFQQDFLEDAFVDEYERTPSEQMQDVLQDMLDYSRRRVPAGSTNPLSFQIKQIFESGDLFGVCQDGGKAYTVHASITADRDDDLKCTCPMSRGLRPCPHTLGFLVFLIDQLRRESSELAKHINQERFTEGEPNFAAFMFDQDLLAIEDLQQRLKELQDSPEIFDQDAETLPTRSSQTRPRLAWDLSFDDDRSLHLAPMLQQPKKRGNGYTKGRKTKLESTFDRSSFRCTDQDRHVLDLIRFDDSYYRYDKVAVMDQDQALVRLVGADNVYHNKQPLEIRRDRLRFRFQWLDDDKQTQNDVQKGRFVICLDSDSPEQRERDFDHWTQLETLYLHHHHHSQSLRSISSTPGLNNGITLFHCGEGRILRLDVERGVLAIAEYPPAIAEAILYLTSFPLVARERFDLLKQQVSVLRRFVTIDLPDDETATTLPTVGSPVVLLRSNPDGTLDLAQRVRDQQGKLRLVGGAPLSVFGQDDRGNQVCYQRDVTAETNNAKQVEEFLGLNPTDRAGQFENDADVFQLKDFGQILAVMERLQTWDFHGGTLSKPELLWDRNSEKPVSVLGTLSNRNVRVEIHRKRDWFGITGSCDFGESQMELSKLLESLAAGDATQIHGDFVRLHDGQWARINEKLRRRLQRLRDVTHTDRKSLKLDATSAPELREFAADGEIEVKAVKAWQQCLERLARAEALDPQAPAQLDAKLRDYQLEGFRWLRRLAEWGVGGVLADDMGLGKTLQTLAVLQDRCQEGPALVVAPTSVGFNWVRETERFAPGLSVHLYRETDRADFLPSVGPGDLVICSYGLALRDQKSLAKVDWSTMVLDEAQAIKNSRSKTSKAIASIPAQWTVALTGTPVENHLGELWSLFHVVSPGVFGGWDQFRKRFAVPIEKYDDDEARSRLAQRLQPFVLRRSKSEVLTELPPRTEMNLYVDLSPAERAEYERVRLSAIGEIDQIESLAKSQDQRFRILALLTRLRQISCNARLVQKSFDGPAAKLQQLIETLTGLKEEGHRALIFSQFTEHLALIREALDQDGFTYEYLDGSTPAPARQRCVDDFQNGTSDAFLISLKAGGTGLNLTAADYVIHMDPWWNPAVEDQATDRAHRIGQQNPVMVYRIIARDTIEEEILSLHDSKRDLVAGVMQGTTKAGRLSNEELIAMLRKTD